MHIHYNPRLKELARQLRRNMTQSEAVLWKRLKGGQFMGHDFHRQKPMGAFIADFYAPALRLVIELDGYSHQFEETARKDQQKDAYLTSVGLSVLHFRDEEVTGNLVGVLQIIENYVLDYQEKLSGGAGDG